MFQREGPTGRRARPWALIITVGIILFVILFIVGPVTTLFTVGAGEVGVRWDPFGKYPYLDPNTNTWIDSAVGPDEYDEGIHIKAPWVRIDKFNVKTQSYTMSSVAEEGEMAREDTVRTVTSEGLYVGLDITVLHHLLSSKADEVRRSLGKEGEYQQILVRPNIRSTIREVVSEYEAADIYGEGRTAVQAQIQERLTVLLEPRGVVVEAVLLRDVQLPTQITVAIEQKKQAEQEALRMVYILEREVLERDRKVIEADGIYQANEIIARSLTGEYLTWYWIDNLKEHQSVVYMVPSDSGLPLFKNIDNPLGQPTPEPVPESVFFPDPTTSNTTTE